MMRWNFQTGKSCSSLTCSKVRKHQCSSFRHNPLPQPRRRPRNGSRTSADLQAATVFRPPSIGRPILFLSAGLIRYETVTLSGLRTSVDEALAGLAAGYPPLPTLTATDPE